MILKGCQVKDTVSELKTPRPAVRNDMDCIKVFVLGEFVGDAGERVGFLVENYDTGCSGNILNKLFVVCNRGVDKDDLFGGGC